MRLCGCWMIAVSILAISGCVGTPGTGQPVGTHIGRPPTIQELAQQLPPWPVDKAVDAVFTTELLGWQSESKSTNAIVEGTNLNLVSGLNEMSWGIWHFNTAAGLQNIQAVIDVPAGNQVYLALSDYSRGTWEFDGPLSAGKTIQLDNALHKSANGNFYIAVITVGGDTAKVFKHVLNAESDWLVATVDDSVFCESTSLAVVGGNPAIAYIDTSNDQLRYVRASDLLGYTWGTPVFPDGSFGAQGHPSLEMVAGKPAISYSLLNNFGPEDYLYYVRALDDQGGLWGTHKEVALYSLLGNNISDTCLAIVNGRPAISYVGQNGLWYVRANDTSGDDWLGSILLVNFNDADRNTTLVVDNGMPVVSFEDTQMGQLKLVGANDADGIDWNPPQMVAANLGNSSDAFSCGALVNNSLAISYFDTAANLLMFARWEFIISDWEYITVDTPADIVQQTSLAVIDGNPAISYYDHASEALKYSRALDTKGTSWSVPVIVDSLNVTGVYSSMVDIGGKPAISYTNNLGELKYAYEVGL